MFYFSKKWKNLHKIWLKVKQITSFIIHARQQGCNKYRREYLIAEASQYLVGSLSLTRVTIKWLSFETFFVSISKVIFLKLKLKITTLKTVRVEKR